MITTSHKCCPAAVSYAGTAVSELLVEGESKACSREWFVRCQKVYQKEQVLDQLVEAVGVKQW